MWAPVGMQEGGGVRGEIRKKDGILRKLPTQFLDLFLSNPKFSLTPTFK